MGLIERKKQMKSLILLLIIAMTLNSCALFQWADNSLEGMTDAEFDNLNTTVYGYAVKGGKKIAEQVTPEVKATFILSLRIIISADNAERARMITDMLGNNEYSPFIKLGISAALDFIEAQTGTKLNIQELLDGRKGVLVVTILTGLVNGMEAS